MSAYAFARKSSIMNPGSHVNYLRNIVVVFDADASVAAGRVTCWFEFGFDGYIGVECHEDSASDVWHLIDVDVAPKIVAAAEANESQNGSGTFVGQVH